jgi:hypothetical protein
MKKIIRKRFLMMLLGVLTAELHAQKTLYSNDFSKGTADVNWRSEVGLDISVVDDAAGIGSGNALQINCAVGLREAGVKFEEVTLAETGDYIEFSCDIRCPNLTDRLNVSFLNDIDNDPRINFAEPDFFGFTLQARVAANSGLYQYTAGQVIGSTKDFPNKTFSAVRTGWGTGAHSQKVRFARIDDKTIKAVVLLDGNTVIDWEIASTDHFVYDTFGLRPVAIGDVILLDNIIITSGKGANQ